MWVVVGCTLTVATALLTVTTLLAALITTLLAALITTLLTRLITSLLAGLIATLLAGLIATLLTGLIATLLLAGTIATLLLTGLVATTIIITRAIAAWLAATRSALEIGSKALGAETTLLIVVTIITVGACGANTGTLWSGAYTFLFL